MAAVQVFVSYRRDDAGGHAGRLCDDLVERLPDHDVFYDVDSLAPGEDFLAAIERAVERADVVLVVIGPQWATITRSGAVTAGGPGPAPPPRISEPDDVVRLEVAEALRTGTRVVPVLVGGATMPAARDLPPDVAPLAGLHAAELRAASWDDDLDRLLATLAGRRPPRVGPVAARPRERRRPPLLVTLAALLAVASILVVALTRGGGDGQEEVTAGDATVGVGAPDVAGGGPGGAAAPAGGHGGEALDLPAVARTELHPPSSDGLVVEVRAASLRQEGSGVVLHLDLRLENRTPYDDLLASNALRVVADGEVMVPRPGYGVLVPARATATSGLDVDLPRRPTDLVLMVEHVDERGEIPLAGAAVRERRPPPLRADEVQLAMGLHRFRVGPASVEVLSDRLMVGVPVRLDNGDRYDVALTDGELRLVVDGEPTAPVGGFYTIVRGGTAEEEVARWEAPLDARTLVLRIERADGRTEVALTT